ncbi:thermonuclease family protein [Novosphingobium sp.]|uniref:thermonuclease family protein n=1 Tax=Novosphingobium sp. TaxID=1874826 RepID=UPI0038BC7EE6
MPLAFLCAMAVAIDGDTLRCRGLDRVRLARIDAPELPGHCRPGRRCAPGDPFAARAALQQLLAPPVRCTQVDALVDTGRAPRRDRYGRIVARCVSGGRDLGKVMLARGLAVRWRSKQS